MSVFIDLASAAIFGMYLNGVQRVEKTPTPDFDGNGQVDIADFLAFAEKFGTSRGDSNYDARYDLDSDGTIGIGDFLIFTASFGTSG